MKLLIQIIIVSFLSMNLCIGQELAEVEGAVTIGTHAGDTPSPGTIHWDGSDFMGFDGFRWKSLTQMIAYDGAVEDVEGNVYPTVIIGDQEWMARNLKTGKYDNEVPIDLELFGGWSVNNTGAYCWYGDRDVYGYLYNWYAVNNSNNLCPSGWRVPFDSDWDELFGYLGGYINNTVGGKLKEKRTAHWLYPNNGATNEVGFTALPAGTRTASGSYQQLEEYGRFWSKSEQSPGGTTASRKYMWSEAYEFFGGFVDKNNGFSVRCMRDVN